MLLEYSVKNFFSFREASTISFKLPANSPISNTNESNLASVICLKGKNASGKTSMLRAISFLSAFCAHSFSKLEPKDYLSVDSFYDNEEPCEFQVEFQVNDITYTYELVTSDVEVIRETLYRKQVRNKKIIERKGNKFTYTTSEFSSLRLIKLRGNASFISTYQHYQIDDLAALNDVYAFFLTVHTNVYYSGLNSKLPDVNAVSQLFYENEDVFKFVKDIIIKCDTGIKDIKIIKTEVNNEVEYSPIFTHEVDGDDKEITFFTESSGTKSLFLQLARYKYALATGALLCLDEFDINLHPHILPVLIELFLDPVKNNNGAQFLFSTHNSEILDTLGRYRVYLIEKQDNESFAYRLDEIPGDILRNDRPIAPVYNSGKIGGVPRL